MACKKDPGKNKCIPEFIPSISSEVYSTLKTVSRLRVLCNIDGEISDTKILTSCLFLEMENCQTFLLDYLG